MARRAVSPTIARSLLAVLVVGWLGCNGVKAVAITPGSGDLLPPIIRTTRIDKVDLLFMIDNSPSMADKQAELARRIPLLIKELTNPDPDPKTGRPKYKPVRDLHVGIITSSLGSYGTSACDDSTNRHQNDHAHLLPRPGDPFPWIGWQQPTNVGDPIASPCPRGIADASALSWTNGTTPPPRQFQGVQGSASMQAAGSCVVESVDEDGCGYENQRPSTTS